MRSEHDVEDDETPATTVGTASSSMDDESELPAGVLYVPNLSERTGWEAYRVEKRRDKPKRVWGFHHD